MHQVRRYPLGLSDDLYVEASRQHLLPQYPDLHFGKTVTDTAMDTEAKGDVLPRVLAMPSVVSASALRRMCESGV